MITQKRLREVLDYDEETGIFRWKRVHSGIKVGRIAGCVHKSGYRRICIDGVSYRASRLAWLYVYGEFPEGQIDHKNGVRDDDRISNIRDVTSRVNCQNRACHRDGKLVGGYWRGDLRKWRAQIRVNGKDTDLGYYDTEQEAHEAYLEALGELEVRG